MKTYSAKSSAIRAASSHFKVARNVTEVEKVAIIAQDPKGNWFWTEKPAPKKVRPATEPRPMPPKAGNDAIRRTINKMNDSKDGKKAPQKVWKRPSDGTKTGRVWALADEFQERALVLESAKREGLNMGMVSQQYYRWNSTRKSAI